MSIEYNHSREQIAMKSIKIPLKTKIGLFRRIIFRMLLFLVWVIIGFGFIFLLEKIIENYKG